MKDYGHLTYEERDRIALLRCAGLSPAAIGRIRRTLAINLILGLIVVAVAMAGRALGLS